ncbi:LysR family transcriptional regulator [Pantoea stewartii]|uniref:LysR family transcriptional regulator n=1 Tax=Pantoea stewartii TaxID=66269 RepID=UPI00197FD611|nr:LysR family transcriptional regulator [Pantoea stewartii]
MKLQHLKYFIAVAEEQHFGRAAEKLGMGQPPLSLQIQSLEKELDVRLFRRRSRGVELTDAGKLLLRHAMFITNYVESTLSDMRRFRRGESGELNVGFAGGTYFNPEITASIHEFRQTHPGVILKSALGNTPELMEKLLKGTVDAAFVRPQNENVTQIEFTPVVKEEMLMALPTSHPLARSKSEVDLIKFADDPFIVCDRKIGIGLYETIISACNRAGFIPHMDQNAPQVAAIIPMVAAGFGVSLVPASLLQIQTPGVKFLKVKGETPTISVALATRCRDPSPALHSFIRTLKRGS